VNFWDFYGNIKSINFGNDAYGNIPSSMKLIKEFANQEKEGLVVML